MSNVLPMFPSPRSVAQYLRIGHTAHKHLESLHQAGRLPIRCALVDAAHIGNQQDLLQTLSESGAELVLDTKAAELSMPVCLGSKASKLPWANGDREHTPQDWKGGLAQELCEQISDFAIANNVDAVIAPTHLILGPNDIWLSYDLKSCTELRSALDRRGGKSIRVDYELIIPMSVLRDLDATAAITDHLGEVDFANLWVRASGFGMAATAVGIQRYFQAATVLAELNRPIIADGVGGMTGIALAAFGAVGGLCHGIAGKDSFNLNGWKKSPDPTSSFGPRKRIYLSEIDHYMYENQARELLEGRGAKSLLLCNDTSCCPNRDDMFDQHRSHALTQSVRLVDRLNSQQEMKRVEYFMDHMLAPVGRALLKAQKLKVPNLALMNKMGELSNRSQLVFRGLESLRDSLTEIPIAPKPIHTRASETKALRDAP